MCICIYVCVSMCLHTSERVVCFHVYICARVCACIECVCVCVYVYVKKVTTLTDRISKTHWLVGGLKEEGVTL